MSDTHDGARGVILIHVATVVGRGNYVQRGLGERLLSRHTIGRRTLYQQIHCRLTSDVLRFSDIGRLETWMTETLCILRAIRCVTKERQQHFYSPTLYTAKKTVIRVEFVYSDTGGRTILSLFFRSSLTHDTIVKNLFQSLLFVSDGPRYPGQIISISLISIFEPQTWYTTAESFDPQQSFSSSS